jgi:Ca2+/Na+ antiporter
MENLNFLPPSFEKKNRNRKIKVYKAVVLVLWICCLALFIIYTFQHHKNKILNTRNINSSKETKPSVVNAANSKHILSINTFKKFLLSLEKDIPYKTLSIDGKLINIESIIESKSQYYEIINLIENKYEYKILYLSSPFDNNETLQFKMIIEVK